MTVKMTVTGIVQGVGYRPFVARLAREMGISGTVMNCAGMVLISASGSKEAIDSFVHRLVAFQPPGADVQHVYVQELREQVFDAFHILSSQTEAGRGPSDLPIIPPDLPMCADCLRELRDPQNRRYRYPFISCVACGPRYSIMETLPYDRNTTVMEDFQMCPECGREYREPDNRRCHAQTISCYDCGPQLILQTAGAVLKGEEALSCAIALLRQGGVLAVKGVGGYQLACLPCNLQAVLTLRRLKHRGKKPFAVMFPDLERLKADVGISPAEARLLTSTAYPIVLLEKTKEVFCKEVCGESRFLGAFLPYTPLHQLLLDACGPLVMTSANVTAEPILYRDEDMLGMLIPDLSGVLYHKRRIVTPLDDSVVRVAGGKPQLLRRSRGYVPLPISLKQRARRPVLAMGGDLKGGFCLYQNDRAYLSQYFGDMDHYAVSKAYQKSLAEMERLFGIHPEVIACDRHPGYGTTRLAERLAGGSVRLVAIQHHHAHAASVMAEHGLISCIGVVFDGTGYGTDGAVWGGEFLLCRGADFIRAAHLDYVPLCGGDAAAKNAALTAECYRCAAGRSTNETVKAAVMNQINTVLCSSVGRLFDAVSAVLEIGTENSYEGACAIALENCAAAYEKKGQPFPLHFLITKNGTIDPVSLVQNVEAAFCSGIEKGALALGFHRALAEMVLKECERLRAEYGETKVALSGGVFANSLLRRDCVALLEDEGFAVYENSAVPMNDSGLCLGQAFLCGQMPAL